MAKLQAESSAVIGARPEAIYHILADYRAGHPRILPRKYFPELTVESGGQGAGTVLRVKSRVGGQERTLRMEVSEPEPGKVLVEKDLSSDMTTTFTVAPHVDGTQSLVTTRTEWTPGGGFMGFMERLFSPGLLRRVYKEELEQLSSVVKEG